MVALLYSIYISTQLLYPTPGKSATITPLFKTGDVSKCNNYRHISILPLSGKILEKIVYSKMNVFPEENNVLIPNQGGFKKSQ